MRRDAIAALGAGPVPAATLAERLMCAVLGIDRAGLIADPDAPVAGRDAETFAAALTRLANGEPLTRIVGTTEFYGRTFEVTPDVLDPRPETEGLVDLVLQFVTEARRKQPWRICDAGTGSGCLAVTLLAELPQSKAVAVDISNRALEVAQRNAVRHGVADRLELRITDMRNAIGGPFDILVSNPPYIRSGDLGALPRSVRNYDPAAALDGGEDGLAFYRGLSTQLTQSVPTGFVAMEVGHDQAPSVVNMVNAALRGRVTGVVRAEPDLSGILRYVAMQTRCG